MTYWHCALSVSLHSWFANGVQISGGCCLESVLDMFMNKVLCWPSPFFLPQVFSLFVDFTQNIYIFYISKQGVWQSATRVRQLPDFGLLEAQTLIEEFNLSPKMDTKTLDLPSSMKMKWMKRLPNTLPTAKMINTTNQSLRK